MTIQIEIDHLAMCLASATIMKLGEHHKFIVEILVGKNADHMLSPSVCGTLHRLRAKLLDWHKRGAPQDAACGVLRVRLQRALMRVGMLALHTSFMQRQLDHVTLFQRRTILRSAEESTLLYSHGNQFSKAFLQSLVCDTSNYDGDTMNRVHEEAYLQFALCGAPVWFNWFIILKMPSLLLCLSIYR